MPAPMSMIIVCSSASSPYATANGSLTISRLSTIPFIELRRYCLFVRSAAAGTPTTARTFAAVDLAVRADADEAEEMLEQLAHGLDVLLRAFFQQAALERAMKVEHGAVGDGVVADEDVRLRTFFATMSAGQPTKLSTTKRSPFDAEIALREVPRSIPTWRISAIRSSSFLLRRVARRSRMRGFRAKSASAICCAVVGAAAASPLRFDSTCIRPRRGWPASRSRRAR